MPSLPTRFQQPKPVNPQVPIPSSFPEIPKEISDRFPSAVDWQKRLNDFWARSNQAIQEAQQQASNQSNSTVVFSVDRFLIYQGDNPVPMFALDDTGVRLGNVLVINTPGRKVYVGAGNYQNDDTPFYIDTLGRFSLGASLTWDPETDTLTIVGVINATSGTIGGFEIGADYIRDSGNSFGLSSVVSGSQDVRFWAGSTFANRGTAPVRIYEDGTVFFGTMLAARITGDGDGLNNLILSLTGSVAGNGSLTSATISNTFTITGNGASTALIYNQNTIVAKSTFTGLTSYGINIALNQATGTGTIDNAYGVYINTVNIGTTNWGLYVATTARNFMAGDLTVASIGLTTPGTGAFTTLSATGLIKSTASTAFQALRSGETADFRIYQGSTSTTLDANNGGDLILATGGTGRATLSSTGLAVTGALSATGNAVIGTASGTPTVSLGGTTSSFPALRYDASNKVGVVLADQSAYAYFKCLTGDFSSTGLAVTGVISTTDPAGGAGPNWKLGIAAAVSPTAPNRTVRIDIGGTSYYLAAKLTND